MWEINPNPGRIKIYTSGCPKNQNKCWYRTGSPPPAGLKKVVLRFRSDKIIVIAPAKTGRDNSNKIVVIKTDHVNSVQLFIEFLFILIIVHKKLIDLRIDEIPAIWREKIVKSIEGFNWVDRGG